MASDLACLWDETYHYYETPEKKTVELGRIGPEEKMATLHAIRCGSRIGMS